MYVEDPAQEVKEEKRFLIKKKAVYVSVALGIAILIGCILVTHYVTKNSNIEKPSLSKPNQGCDSTVGHRKSSDQDCKQLFCSSPDILNGWFFQFFKHKIGKDFQCFEN